MICQVTNATIDCQDLEPNAIGRWLLVTMGCFFLFDLREEAVAIRAVLRQYAKCDKIVH